MKTKHHPKPQNAPDPEEIAREISKESLRAGHEVTDVSPLGLALFGVGLAASLAIVFVAMALLFRVYWKGDNYLDQKIVHGETGPVSQVQGRPDYRGPKLQVLPETDLRAMREGDARKLVTYGWIDRGAGTVRLPIDRAMALLAERGIPPISPGQTLESIQQQRAQPQVYGQVLRP